MACQIRTVPQALKNSIKYVFFIDKAKILRLKVCHILHGFNTTAQILCSKSKMMAEK